jgi:hypothetical protein
MNIRSVSFSFPLSPHTNSPQTVLHVHSCPIIIITIVVIMIILSLGSTNEQEHALFWLLSLACLSQRDELQFHQFSCKWHNFIFLYGWVIFLDIYILYTFILYIYHISFIYSSVVGHLGYFSIVKRDELNVDMQVSLLHIDLCSLNICLRVV